MVVKENYELNKVSLIYIRKRLNGTRLSFSPFSEGLTFFFFCLFLSYSQRMRIFISGLLGNIFDRKPGEKSLSF